VPVLKSKASRRPRINPAIFAAAGWARAVRVIEPADLPEGGALRLNANTLKQKVVCYLERKNAWPKHAEQALPPSIWRKM